MLRVQSAKPIISLTSLTDNLIINMIVQYLKNLSFYAICIYKYNCRKMYIVLLPLQTLGLIEIAKLSCIF
jgi:hypothetical protein